MVVGCRRENAWVWMTIDLMTLAMLGLVWRPGPLSTPLGAAGTKMFVFLLSGVLVVVVVGNKMA